MEHTLALVKPDAVGKAAELQQLAELGGFQIVAKRTLQLTQHMAEAFYAEHTGKPFYPSLVEFMTSGPVVALVLAKADAIRGWREVMGPTDVFEARVTAPKCLRALYGTTATRNAVHGSDSPESAAREIAFFFPHGVTRRPRNRTATRSEDYRVVGAGFIKERLQPTLLKALSALAKEKPSSKPAEAVTFLATFLLQHNPLKPHTEVPPELAAQQLKQVQAAAKAAAAGKASAAAARASAVSTATAAAGRLAARPAAAGVAMGAAAAPAGGDSAQQQAMAATKVQAAFRGHQARKQVAGMRGASKVA